MKKERENWDRLINKIMILKKEDEIITKNWILKDVVMHIYIYELEIKKAIQTKSLKEHHFWTISYPKRNEEIFNDREKYSLEQVLELDKENFQSLLAEIEKLHDEDICSSKFFKDSRKLLQNLIKGNSYGHYHEHIPKLRKRFAITD